MRPGWVVVRRDGGRLSCRDFGGTGPAALLLHGLAGHAEEWSETAAWLTARCRVVAVEARGHGRSTREPADVSREAHVADAATVVEELGLAPVVLVGQSLGGHTAMLLAARRPDLVRGLVVAEGSPAAGADDLGGQVQESLGRWPVPFASQEAAVAFFGGPGLRAEAWAAGLQARDGEWWPRFDIGVLVRTLREAVRRPQWDQWARIRCPVLVVRGHAGRIPPADAHAMVDALGGRARLVEPAGAGHDVHLERPAEWRRAVESLLDDLGVPGGGPGAAT